MQGCTQELSNPFVDLEAREGTESDNDKEDNNQAMSGFLDDDMLSGKYRLAGC